MSKGINLIDGSVFDPKNETFSKQNIALKNGKVLGLGVLPDDNDDDFEVINAKGHWIIPNITDAHVHLAHASIDHLSDTALTSGVTALGLLPSKTHPFERPEGIDQLARLAAKANSATIHPLGAIQRFSEPQKMAEIGLMREKGIGCFVALFPLDNAQFFETILRYCSFLNVTLVVKPIDGVLRKQGMMHEGLQSQLLGLDGISRQSESCRVARDIEILRQIGGRLHFSLISTKESVSLIRRAQEDGLQVSAGTSPHYLTLTDEDLVDYDPALKVLPPFREAADQNALAEGIQDGVITCLVSDHHYWGQDVKQTDFVEAEFGFSALESFIPLSLQLCDTFNIKPETLFSCLTKKAHQVLSISPPGISLTNSPSFTVIDPNASTKLSLNPYMSPFFETAFKGKVVLTVHQGKIVYRDGHVA